jgi:uncharacterized protein (DUF1778 family)
MERIRYASALQGTTVSAFVVDAAYERAEQVIDDHRSTLVPSDYFDRLLAALDEAPHVIPELAAASRRNVVQGQGLGRQLLVDALSRAVSAVEIVSGRYIVVDAIDENAVAFYHRYGFTPLPAPSASRLIMKSSDASASLTARPPTGEAQAPEKWR